MGYVQPTSLMEQLDSPDAAVREGAAREMLEGYNQYRAGMRSGIFGAIFGRFLFPKARDRKPPAPATNWEDIAKIEDNHWIG